MTKDQVNEQDIMRNDLIKLTQELKELEKAANKLMIAQVSFEDERLVKLFERENEIQHSMKDIEGEMGTETYNQIMGVS